MAARGRGFNAARRGSSPLLTCRKGERQIGWRVGISSRRDMSRTGDQHEPWPTELRLRPDRRALAVVYDDGAAFELPAEYLRIKSPSAEVQGHAPDERKTVPGKRQ